jgi:hypothetical protein
MRRSNIELPFRPKALDSGSPLRVYAINMLLRCEANIKRRLLQLQRMDVLLWLLLGTASATEGANGGSFASQLTVEMAPFPRTWKFNETADNALGWSRAF